ncbi:MAG: flagellin [Alphaproteobacteria bacterium]
MSTDIALTNAQRTNIATLRDIQKLSDRTQDRLTTGREVNTVIDDAVAYFTAKGLTNRADDLSLRKSEIDQGISALTATLEATDAIENFLQQMKALAEATRSQTTVERASSTEQFTLIGTQISRMVEDASYRGYNLLSEVNNEMEVRFSEKDESRLVVGGYDFNSTSASENGARQLFSSVSFATEENERVFLGMSTINTVAVDGGGFAVSFSQIGDNNSALFIVDSVVNTMDKAIARLRATVAELGSHVSILQTRLNFTEAYVDTHYGGSDKLTLADMNEEGANITALQTRQQLGIQALSISGDQQSSVITLLQ